MKYLCSSCERLVEPEGAELIGEALRLTCPKCKATEDIDIVKGSEAHHDTTRSTEEETSSRSAPKSGLVESESVAKCPKCHAPRTTDEACPACGLVYERWSAAELEVPQELRELWGQLGKKWDDKELHQEFLNRCLALSSLAFAARCYRERDDAMAQLQLQRLTIIGVQAMQLAEQPDRLDPRVFRIVGWTLFGLLCLGLVIMAFMVR
jgi:DNA-directed RNA polymerase subunit M/transcription elongation factor TFIIS